MKRTSFGRSAAASLAGAILLLTAVAITSLAANTTEDHPVVGRWNVISDAGGAVWAFQPSGVLVVTGPGEITSEGSWTPAAGPEELDATVDAQITGQQLAAMAQVSPTGPRSRSMSPPQSRPAPMTGAPGLRSLASLASASA